MEVHINTASETEKAKAKKVKGTPAKKPSAQSAPAPAPAQKKKPNLPKSPQKEPKPPSDVKSARKQQTRVLKERQNRETQGKAFGSRDIDAGSGFWPPLSPLL